MLINPIATNVIYTNGPGLDLHTDPPNQFAIADAEFALIHNSIQEAQRNAPNGFAGLDNLSTVNAAVRVQYIDAATLNGLVPRSGELFVTNDTKELRYGDSLKPGGFRAGLNSKSQIYVGADDTPMANGLALINAYGFAKTASPNGAAKSVANRMNIVLGAGVYDVTAAGGLTFDTPFIDIVGLGGTPDSVRLQIVGLNINDTCFDFGLRNLTFYKSGTGHNITWRLQGNDTVGPVQVNWENLRFEGIAADTILNILSRASGTTTVLNGTFKNVKTACAQFLQGSSNLIGSGHTINLTFDDVQAGDKFIGLAPTSNRLTFNGTMRNCVFTNTSLVSFTVGANAVLHNTKFGMPLNFLTTGARVTYCRFVPAAGVASLKGIAATQNCFIAHNELSATGIDAATLTTTAGATLAAAFNTQSDS